MYGVMVIEHINMKERGEYLTIARGKARPKKGKITI